MRNSLGLVKKLALLILAVLLVVAAGLLPLTLQFAENANNIASPATNQIVAYAANSSSGTWLNGSGLQIGYNYFDTRASNTEGTASGGGSYSNARDFYVNASTFEYSATSFDFSNGNAYIKSMLVTSADTVGHTPEMEAGVYYAIIDPNISVSLKLGGSLRNANDTSPTSVTITLSWYANSGSLGGSVSQTINLDSGEENVSMASVELNGINYSGMSSGAHIDLQFNSAGSIGISDPTLEVSVDSSNSIVLGEQVQYEIAGKNRQTVGPITYGNEGDNVYFIKGGDTITLRTKAFQGTSTSLYKFPSHCQTVYDTQGSNGIYWDIYTYDIEHPGVKDYDATYITRLTTTSGYTDDQGNNLSADGQWYEMQFTVQNGAANIDAIYFEPTIYIHRDGSGKVSTKGNTIIFNVDDSAPEAPVIDPTSELGAAIEQSTWYTSDPKNSPILKFTEKTHTVRANEYIYAFVLPSDVVSISGWDDYDFTPGSTTALTYSEGSTATRQEIVSYDANGVSIKGCKFDSSGQWGLVLVAVDAAGNVSSPKYYNDYNYNPVYIDGSTYAISVNFLQGSSIISTPATLGDVYMIYGSGTHDANGNLIEDSEDLYHYQSTYKVNVKNGSISKEIARLQWVTIRIVMKEQQYKNYQMVSYTNKGTINGTDVSFVVPTEDGRSYYFDLPTFQITDDIVNNPDVRGMDCVFRTKLNLEVIGATSGGIVYETFTGNNISIADSVEAHKKDTNATLVQGLKIDVNYYATVTWVAFPASSGVGGTIGENTYTSGSIYLPGNNVFLNGKTYTIISYEENAKVNNNRNYTVLGYCADEPRLDEMGYSLGYVDAGTYFYTASISADEVEYFGNTSGKLIINKASPNVTDISANTLTYGVVGNNGRKGLDLLEFESMSQDGSRLVFSDASNRYIFDTTYYSSYYGILGLYSIVTPSKLESVYYSPDVTDGMQITVKFTPITVTIGSIVNGIEITPEYIINNYSIMSKYYDLNGSTVTLKEGGLHAGNYDTQTLVLKIVVTHALIKNSEIEIDSDLEVEYDGLPKAVSLITTPAKQPYLVYYKLQEEPETAYSTTQPFNAGIYDVKYYIDSANCNYYSEPQVVTLKINKRVLDITLTNFTNIINTPYSFTGYAPFTQRIDVDYGYFTRPAVQATYTVGSNVNIVNVIYYISYMQIEDYAGTKIASPEMTEAIDESELDSTSVAAGLYLVKLVINNNNNQGELVCLVKVAQASTSGSNKLLITYPALNSSYTAYTLQQNTVMSVGNDSTIGNIEYGQTISEMEESLIALTENTFAQYMFRGNANRTAISGRFYLEKEYSIFLRYSLDFDSYNAKNELILPVRFETDLAGSLNDIAPYEIYLYWQAGEYDIESGDFISNDNFEVERMKVTFYVVRATPDFDSVTLSTLTYGEALEEATFVGIPSVAGGMNIGGSNVSGDDDKIVAERGVEFVGKNVLVGYQENGELAYILGYEMPASTKYQRGTYSVDCIFLPFNDFAKKYCKAISIKINISITAMPATIEFVLDENDLVSHDFGASYADPAVITNPAGISVRYEFYTTEGAKMSLTGLTPVGEYKVKAIIDDDNYEGELESAFYVVKSALAISIPPTNAPQSYGVKLGEISLSSGRCYSLGNVAIDGTFAFVNAEEIPEVGTAYYLVRFTPNDATAYDSYLVFEYNYSLTITKAEVEIAYSGLVYTYDGTGKTPVASAKDPEGNELTVNILFTNWRATAAMPIPENAGSYNVNLQVNTNHYYKSVNVTMIINKASATINTDPQYVKYTGAPKVYEPVFDVEGLTYKLSYVNYYGTQILAPADVGEYTVGVTIDHMNYQGSANVKFYIEPYSYTLNNLEQTYNPFGNIDVTASFLPEEINYTVLYRSVGAVGSYSEMVPTEAGSYNVILRIDQNGYMKDKSTMVTETGEYDIILKINPAVAVINAPAFTRTYTARPHTDLVCDVTPSVSTSYKYRVAGSHEEYSTTQPILSGYYEVYVEISDKNYVGSAETTLFIDKATPVVGTLPAITSTNCFNGTKDDVTFSGSGSVIFTATGEYLTSKGHWEIDENDAVFTLLPVGTHNVHITFIPDDDDNFYPAKYFDAGATEEATIDIIISKKDIGEYIDFDTTQLVQMYKAKQLYVDAFLRDTSILVEGYKVPTIIVTYNGQQIRPSSVGKYVLGAYILDDNYAGNAVESEFEITRADLSIKEPTLSSITVGQKVSNSTISGGYAYIYQEAGDVMATVDGAFAFTYPDTVYPRANYQKVWLTFTPDDVRNHNVHSFQMEIFVVGEAVQLEINEISSITFGQKLSECEFLDYTSSVPGKLEWVNPDAILTTGERGKYIFTPDEHDIYNIVTGTIDVEVNKANMWLDKQTFSIKVYISDEEPFATLGDAIITADLYHNDHQGDPDWLIDGALIKFAEGNNLNMIIKTPGCLVDAVGNAMKAQIEITHRDYNTYGGQFEVWAYYKLTDENFQVANSSKIYDGKEVKLEDLNAYLVGTQYQIDNDDFLMKVERDGVVVDKMIEAGDYTVTISIKIAEYDGVNVTYRDVAYDGSYTFTYTIEKLDISSSITMSETTKTYGDYSTTVKASFGEYTIPESDVIFSYYSTDLLTEYGVVAPQSAGTYIVKASISNANSTYKGSATATYTINQREATIKLESSYSVTYGTPYSIVPDISNNITSQNYTVTYNNSTTIPENVGEYVVKFVINHPNFFGTASTKLVIKQATPSLDTAPSLSAIKYGQELYNSIISGGRVVYGSSQVEVSGEFVFEDPSSTGLAAGNNTVSMIFKPTNTNYSSLLISVPIVIKKGDASIELVSPTAIYDGTSKSPLYVTQPLAGLTCKLVFRQNSIIDRNHVAAGIYEVTISIEDPNYEGENVFEFTILKASPITVVEPQAGNLSYGQSLSYSSLYGGSLIYSVGGSPISGTFKYDNSGLQLGDVGVYENVAYTFIPTDSNNYEEYHGLVEVTVVQATASIAVTNIEYTYGERITSPVFITTPANLAVKNDAFEASGLTGTVPHVNTFEFDAYINDSNYVGSVTYVISISKKQISVNFVNANNVKVDRYTTTYNKTLYAKAAIDSSTLATQDTTHINDITEYIMYYYSSANGKSYSHIPPTTVGEYSVYCDMNHTDYYIKASSTEIPYIINRAKVEYLEFDTASLSNQVYGSVSVPTVVTTPTNIAYIVSFPGYTYMPTDAGTYSIKVLVVDDNYEPAEKSSMFRISPKDVTIESITCENRVVDGTDNIVVKGEVKGVLIDDEVILNMTAKTAGGETTPGTYKIKITSYELTGLHAGNYNVLEPIYSLEVKLKSKAVYDTASGSYITSQNGLSENVTVTFSAVSDTQNKSNMFSSIFGQDVVVETFEIKENGIRTTLGEKIKVYVKIPDKYLGSDNIVVEGLGDLSTEAIAFSREGDYITFYTDKSGEVAIYTEDFPYWVIIVVSIVAMIVIGVICVFVFSPLKRRKRIPNKVRRIYAMQQQAEAEYRRAHPKNNGGFPGIKF